MPVRRSVRLKWWRLTKGNARQVSTEKCADQVVEADKRYEICNWDKMKTYRVSGDYYPANQVICFDLNKPCEIVDGKVATSESV